MVNIAFTWEKVYFENSCHSHTPMSDPFALGKIRFFPKSSALYKIYFLGQNIGTQCYAQLINIGLACVLYSGLLLYKHIHVHRIIMSLQMPWKALQTWTNLNNTQVWQMHIYLPPKITLHCINFKKKGNLWKGHPFTICRHCISATATVFKTNHYIWC